MSCPGRGRTAASAAAALAAAARFASHASCLTTCLDSNLLPQRTITAKLEEELGMPLSAHKPLIKVRRMRLAHAARACGSRSALRLPGWLAAVRLGRPSGAAAARARLLLCCPCAQHASGPKHPHALPLLLSPAPCRRRLTSSCPSSRTRRTMQTTTLSRSQHPRRRGRSAALHPPPLRATVSCRCPPSALPACAALAGGSWRMCGSFTRRKASCRWGCCC